LNGHNEITQVTHSRKPKTSSPSDLELWSKAIEDVTPLQKKHVVLPAHSCSVIKQPSTAPQKQVWDLHGHTLSEAWALTQHEIQHSSHTRLTFITGKSGAINQEFLSWLEHNRQIKSVKPVRGGGAYQVDLKKPQP
jgi:DNA-nicking Smr family endonuclease